MNQPNINLAVEFALSTLSPEVIQNGISPEEKEDLVNLILAFPRYASIPREKFLRALESYVPIFYEENPSYIVGKRVKQQKHWLTEEMKLARKFWIAYEQRMRDNSGLSDKVRARIDKETDDILEFTGDPSVARLQTKGLVIGDVQSGKTSNFTGLITKAADSGYKVIIVTTGILESLRRQTQERLERDFVGSSTSGARQISSPCAHTMTTCLDDFNQFHNCAPDNLPTLFVVKKNAKILARVVDHIKTYIRQYQHRPLLFIDDEADNASINTNPADENTNPTAINSLIRSILELFPRSAYVGYTATPYANVFIDPFTEQDLTRGDTEAEVLKHRDLFPDDFIYLLTSSSEYCGAEHMFGQVDRENEGEEFSSSSSRDYTLNLLPDKGEEQDFMEALQRGRAFRLPESLKTAIRTYLLARAVHEERGRGEQFCGMLIHFSHRTQHQNQVYVEVRRYLYDLLRQLKLYGGDEDNFSREPALRKIRQAWDEQYEGKIPETWSDVVKNFGRDEFLDCFVPYKVNSDKDIDLARELEVFDYSRMNKGTAAIVLGGNCLARGITIEGLTVTYFLRNSRTYDTLMQMGRWFGYRRGYKDICRVFTTRQIADYFSQIVHATRELKDSIDDMNKHDMTPLTFGLMVRNGEDGLTITSRSKLRTASRVYGECSANISGKLKETHVVSNDKELLRQNNDTMLEFIRYLAANYARHEWQENELPINENNYFWKSVPMEIVLEHLRKFKSMHCFAQELGKDGSLWGEMLFSYLSGYDDIDISLISIEESPANKPLPITDDICIYPYRRNPPLNPSPEDESLIKFYSSRFFSKGDDRGCITTEQAKQLTGAKKSLKGVSGIAFRQLPGRKPLLMLGFAWLPEKYDDIKPGESLAKLSSARLPKLVCGYGVSCPCYDQQSDNKMKIYLANRIHQEHSRPEPDDPENS